ncbi:CHAD domain-containing protein [Bosea sp. (in: a-proteobacteria)]|uniref:CHAD domain-containing protein n=1 Tax=Bosea sp. (in: a-proteobacteria) TaxID=1871050 RepID=UPI0025C18063|nr:CHAD domain-containing protein [Bosea sp. (in: a-proteobacteria)]
MAGRSQVEARAALARQWSRHWLRACREIPERALGVLDRPDEPGRRIHDFRRLMKAWRALLRLAPAALAEEARAVRREAGRLRRRFGVARDADVVARILRKLCPARGKQPQGQDAAGELLRGQRDSARRALRRLSERVAGWSLPDHADDFLTPAFRRSYRKARRQAGGDPRQMDVESLHGWRTRIVDLGYQLSFLSPADPGRLTRLARRAERLRGRLGEVIDLNLVSRHLAEQPPPESGSWLEHEIERRTVRQRRRAAKLAARLFARRPRRVGAELQEAISRRPPRRIKLT